MAWLKIRLAEPPHTTTWMAVPFLDLKNGTGTLAGNLEENDGGI
jgi:hypothetical protein